MSRGFRVDKKLKAFGFRDHIMQGCWAVFVPPRSGKR